MIRPLVAIALAASLSASAQDTPKAKLSVMPFAALTGDVPPRAGTKATGMLTQEFKSADTFVLVDSKKNGADDPATAALDEARKAVEEAKGLRAKKKFRLAEEALKKAVAAYEKAVPALPEMGELVDALALLSAVQFNTGRDEDGQKSLNNALSLAPDRDLPLAATSGLFSKLVESSRKNLKDGPKGNLLLESSPSNAPITLDGVPLGATPLAVKDVPPGLHAWRAQLPTGEALGGFVEVSAGKTANAKAASSSKDPEARLLIALAQNKLDADALTAAKEQAKATEADLLVFGALSKEGKGLALDSFLYAAASGEIRRLPRAKFDTELLSAGMEFYNLAGELSKKGKGVGEPVKVPSGVAVTLTASAAKTAEAKYGQQPGKELDVEGIDTGVGGGTGTGAPPADGQRKPLEQKRRVPLIKK